LRRRRRRRWCRHKSRNDLVGGEEEMGVFIAFLVMINLNEC